MASLCLWGGGGCILLLMLLLVACNKAICAFADHICFVQSCSVVSCLYCRDANEKVVTSCLGFFFCLLFFTWAAGHCHKSIIQLIRQVS